MRAPRDKSPRLKQFAREMRSNPTDAEKRLWSCLRHKQLEGFRFRRQYPIAGYIIDFFCVPARLGIEADGSQHLEQFSVEYDRKRTDILSRIGIRILRFSDVDVLRDTEAVVDKIYTELTAEPPPQPSPGVPEEGE